jgi:voltage-gated potassium channel
MTLTASSNPFQRRLRHLYEGTGREADRFRYALLVFDLATLAFIVATSFVPRNSVIEWLDVLFGLVILFDFSARLVISKYRLRDLLNPWTWADAVAIVSFLAPFSRRGCGILTNSSNAEIVAQLPTIVPTPQ